MTVDDSSTSSPPQRLTCGFANVTTGTGFESPSLSQISVITNALGRHTGCRFTAPRSGPAMRFTLQLADSDHPYRSTGVALEVPASASWDSSFGSDSAMPGRVTLSYSSGTNEIANRVVIDGTGRIVVVGQTGTASKGIAMARLLSTGELDSEFDGPSGSGNGSFAFNLGTDINGSIATSSDLGLWVGVRSTNDATDNVWVGSSYVSGGTKKAVIRLTSSGDGDSSFNSGSSYRDIGDNDQQLTRAAIDPSSGEVYVVRADDGSDKFRIRQIAADGSSDTEKLTPTLTGSPTVSDALVAIDSSGRPLIAGVLTSSPKAKLYFSRFLAGSSFAHDSGFLSTGSTTVEVYDSTAPGTSLLSDFPIPTAAAVDGQNRLIVAGHTDSDVAFVGRLDTSSGTFTIAEPPQFSPEMETAAVAIQATDSSSADGVLIAGQESGAAVGQDQASLVRYQFGTGFDGNYGGTTNYQVRLTIQTQNCESKITSLAVQSDGRIVVAGYYEHYNGVSCGDKRFFVGRLWP